MLRSMFICLSAMLMFSQARSQENFVQFIADGLSTHDEVMNLMNVLNEREDIVSCRAEFYSDNVVLFLADGISFSRDEIAGWPEFEHLGVMCFRKGITGVDLVLRLRKEDCDDQLIDNED